jgi:YidC/Oxa1 family membrane protein insertase
MRQKNLIIFCIISFLILILWMPLKHLIWPPPPPPLRLPDQHLWAGLPGQLAMGSPPGLTGIGPALPQLAQVGLTNWSAGDQKAWISAWLAAKEKPAEQPPKPAPPVVAQKPKPVKPAGPVAPHVEKVLSNKNIRAVITSRGAGIKSLTLIQFKEADRMGRPVDEELRLLPDAEDGPASFLIYHFRKPDAKADDSDNPPVDTLGQLEWTFVNNGDDGKAVLKAVPDPEVIVNGQKRRVAITKTYTLSGKDYHLGLEIELKLLDGDPKESINFGYQLAGPLRMPIEGIWYTNIFRNAVIGGYAAKGRNSWRDLQDSRTIDFQGGGRDLLQASNEDKYIKFGGVATQYFASMMVVDDDPKTAKDFIKWARPTLEMPSPDPNQPALADITVRLNAEAKLKPGESLVHKYLLYNGPVKVRLLGLLEGEKAVEPELIDRYENSLHLNQLTDYGRLGFWSELIIVCTNVMHRLLWFLHSYVMPWSFGLCIIMLTILVRGSMFPLSRKQALQSAKMQAKMRELAPELKQLEDKHKNDPMGFQQAKNELMLKRGINPMAMLGSCWIVLAQMPIFLGLYYALQESIYFRLAPFLWFKNLAAPDMVFDWGESIPFISKAVDMGFLGHWGPFLGPYFNIFPIIWVVLQIIQQKMMMLPPTSEQEAMQQKMMKYMMVVIGVMFYKVAAGLCLYFIASALWSLAERKLLPKSQLAPAAPGAGGTAGGRPNPPPGPRPRPRPKPSNGDGVMQKVKDWWEKILEEAKKK